MALVGDKQNFTSFCYLRIFQRFRHLSTRCSCPSTPFVLQLDLVRTPPRHSVLQSSDLIRAEVLKVGATVRCSSCSITKGLCPSTSSILLQYEFRDRTRTFCCQEHFHPQAEKNHKFRPPLVHHRNIPG